jgi:hypothetical protein
MTRAEIKLAVERAFNVPPGQVRERLREYEGGRLTGLVVVSGSPEFAKATLPHRSARVWKQLRQIAGAEPDNVGVLMLMTAEEAAAAHYRL